MGRTVCAAVAAAEDMQLVAAMDPAAAGATVAELLGDGGGADPDRVLVTAS
ncbi:MAG: 4-hydroxy-tetrahydrodipicolinate reductase, partial [bacterium]|nr:4-hydroxy-tetrahydrodipicolinate reductase [bacterium]